MLLFFQFKVFVVVIYQFENNEGGKEKKIEKENLCN
jgi:hypothetical protein